MRKKIILVFSFMFLVCAMLISHDRINVMADMLEEDNSDVTLTVYWKTGEVEVINVVPEDVIIPSVRGNAPPNFLYNLTKSPYTYSINGMTQFLYTDFFFNPDSNGGLAISTDGLNSGGKSIKIQLMYYNGLFDSVVTTWTGNPQSIQGLGYSNLSTSGRYHFLFKAYDADSVSGEGMIHHP